MSKQNDGGPAFPNKKEGERGYGMSLRDYFAAEALPAVYAETCRESVISGWAENWKVGVALEAYQMADAMLAARAKP